MRNAFPSLNQGLWQVLPAEIWPWQAFPSQQLELLNNSSQHGEPGLGAGAPAAPSAVSACRTRSASGITEVQRMSRTIFYRCVSRHAGKPPEFTERTKLAAKQFEMKYENLRRPMGLQKSHQTIVTTLSCCISLMSTWITDLKVWKGLNLETDDFFHATWQRGCGRF